MSSYDLSAAALQTVTDNGFHPDFPPEAIAELNALTPTFVQGAVDQRNLLWSSIDNDTSRDLDQIEVAEQLPDGSIRVLVGIADVDAYVRKGLALDAHAQSETTTVYAQVRTFPMLPEQLSTGLTSLLENEDRAAVVTEYIVGTDGEVSATKSYAATVRNKAQLTYNGVGPWLDGTASAPPKVAASPELQAQLKLQNTAAQRLLEARHRLGALSFERMETTPIFIMVKSPASSPTKRTAPACSSKTSWSPPTKPWPAPLLRKKFPLSAAWFRSPPVGTASSN